ncbi:MAG: hypothetical protein ACI9DC_005345 [Gammaproteobacteria bacterium]|jgi:hypothetical protein
MLSLMPRALLVVLLAVALNGCATLENQSRTTQLGHRAKLFVKAIRWGEFQVAADMLRRRDGELVGIDANAFEGIRVTSENYALAASDPGAIEAGMTAEFEYTRGQSVSLKKLRYSALWWYESESKRWFIDGILPAF